MYRHKDVFSVFRVEAAHPGQATGKRSQSWL